MTYIVHKIKKIYDVFVKRAIGILAGAIIFMGITQIFNEMYVECFEYSDVWHPVLWQQFYKDKEIDNLYLGSSHVFCDINPKILDQLTGENNFNLASAAQSLRGSYYLLREADHRNQLSHVYLEMYYYLNQDDQGLGDYPRDWHNTDYMAWSFNKAAYMLSIGGVDQYINTLFPYTRYRQRLDDWEYITKVLERKKEMKEMDRRDYPWEMVWEDGDNGYRKICEKGFSNLTRILENEEKYMGQRVNMKKSSMGEQSEKYCRKIIEYCKNRKIPLTLFVSPINDLELVSTQDYDNYVRELRKLAAEYDLTVYDFNLAKEKYLPLQDRNYRDKEHLNATGASLFTPFFYQVVSGEEADNRKYFYDSYKEKLQSLAPAVYGAYYIDYYDDSGGGGVEQRRKVCVASNRDQGMEYRIIITSDGGEQYIVQDFQANKEFYVPPKKDSFCTIVARMKAFPDDVVQTIEFYIRG